jgi:hypothetical protein
MKYLIKIFTKLIQGKDFLFNFLSKVFRFIWQIRKPLVCILHSVVLLFITYWWLNLPFDYDAGEEHLTWFTFIKEQFSMEPEYHVDFDSIVFINIAYDKVLVPVEDAYGIPAGVIPITDREKLDSLLTIINRNNFQKLVFMDIDFDEEYPQDTSLAKSMAKTKNLFIPSTSNPQINKEPVIMGEVSGQKTLVSGDFFKYPYIFQGKQSIPVKFFQFLDNGTFQKSRFLYFRNGKLAFNSIVPNYYFKQFPKYKSDGNINYFDLGTDILTLECDNIEQLLKNKIVIIGALTEYDQHETFVGRMPGVLILLNAYYNLKYGNNEISIWLILIFWLTYLFFSIKILQDKSIIFMEKLKDRLSNFKVIGFILRLASFSIVFVIISILIRLIFDVYLNILLIGIYFALMSDLVSTLRRFKKKRSSETRD